MNKHYSFDCVQQIFLFLKGQGFQKCSAVTFLVWSLRKDTWFDKYILIIKYKNLQLRKSKSKDNRWPQKLWNLMILNVGMVVIFRTLNAYRWKIMFIDQPFSSKVIKKINLMQYCIFNIFPIADMYDPYGLTTMRLLVFPYNHLNFCIHCYVYTMALLTNSKFKSLVNWFFSHSVS